jgi:hypothetical protein
MTSTSELERLVQPSDLRGRQGRHGRRRGWVSAVVAALTAILH